MSVSHSLHEKGKTGREGFPSQLWTVENELQLKNFQWIKPKLSQKKVHPDSHGNQENYTNVKVIELKFILTGTF